MKKLTQEEVIENLNKKHNYFYDYSKVEYINNKTKFEIICPTHGSFWQTYTHHYNDGTICPKCKYEKLSKTNAKKDFNSCASKIHNNFYDYSKVVYTNNRAKVEIICPVHGSFWQRPNNHLGGNGCPNCKKGKRAKSTKKEKLSFIEKVKLLNIPYDYSKVVYTNNRAKVEIICPVHGSFWQRPIVHLRSQICPLCSRENAIRNRVLSVNDFIERANEVHNGKYSYEKVKYESLKNKVEIICPNHGSFLQVAQAHLSGEGCPRCSLSKGEEKIQNLLIENNVSFEKNKRFKKLGLLSYDFYLQKENTLIEFNGVQHYKFHSFLHRNNYRNFLKQKHHDWLKRKYAKDEGFTLVSIPYWDFNNIEDILDKIIYKK